MLRLAQKYISKHMGMHQGNDGKKNDIREEI
jgi:hypothetical protein